MLALISLSLWLQQHFLYVFVCVLNWFHQSVMWLSSAFHERYEPMERELSLRCAVGGFPEWVCRVRSLFTNGQVCFQKLAPCDTSSQFPSQCWFSLTVIFQSLILPKSICHMSDLGPHLLRSCSQRRGNIDSPANKSHQGRATLSLAIARHVWEIQFAECPCSSWIKYCSISQTGSWLSLQCELAWEVKINPKYTESFLVILLAIHAGYMYRLYKNM